MVEQNGALVGMVTEHDFLSAAPSPAGSLSIFEWSDRLARLLVSQLMSSPVIIVREDCPIEQAAALMRAKKSGNIVHLFSHPDTDPAFLQMSMALQDITTEDLIPLLTDIIGVDILSVQVWQREDCVPNYHWRGASSARRQPP